MTILWSNYFLGMDFRRELIFSPGSFILTGLVETAAIPYLGLKIEELSLDEKAEILFLDQGYGSLLFGLLSFYYKISEKWIKFLF